MTYWVNHLNGDSEVDVPIDKLPELYDELSGADDEHTDVSLTHESEWCLSAFKSGLLVWENVAGDGEPKHMRDVASEKTLSLWKLLANGEIQEIEKENWQQGYS